MGCTKNLTRVLYLYNLIGVKLNTASGRGSLFCIKMCKVAKYIPSLIVPKNVVVDTKVIAQIPDHEREKMIYYLKITTLKVGPFLNFS